MEMAQKRLQSLYKRAAKKKRGWGYISKQLGLNKGLVYNVATGRRQPTPQVLKALGLPPRRQVRILACAKCGKAHTPKRCPEKPTFTQRVSEYEAWLKRSAARLAVIVEWVVARE